MTTRQSRYRLCANPLPKHLRAWTLDEIRTLRGLADAGVAVDDIARQLKRTPGAVRHRAFKHGISLANLGAQRHNASPQTQP